MLVHLHYHPKITEKMSVYKAGSHIIVVILVTAFLDLTALFLQLKIMLAVSHATAPPPRGVTQIIRQKAFKPLQDFFRLPF